MERENEGIKQLSKEELAFSISQPARHIIFNDPPEIKGKYVGSNLVYHPFPTRLISFPEFKTSNFASNIRLFGAESVLGIDFHDWRDIKVGILRRKVVLPETTALSINVGISPDKFFGFSIQFGGAIPPKELHYSPSISKDKWHSRYVIHARPLTMDDLRSFKKSVDFVYDSLF